MNVKLLKNLFVALVAAISISSCSSANDCAMASDEGVAKIKELINESSEVFITPHKNIDLDALNASALASYVLVATIISAISFNMFTLGIVTYPSSSAST